MTEVVTIPHIRLTFGGTYFATEEWQIGLHMSNPTPALINPQSVSAWCADKIGDVVTDVKAWAAIGRSGLSAAATLDWLKFNPIGADGKYADPDHVHQRLISPSVVCPGSPDSPADFAAPQLAMCVSLRSAIAGTRASHGRVYIPVQGYAVDWTGHVSSGAVGEIAQNFANLLRALNEWPGIDPLDSSVVSLVTPDSPARAASPGKPARPYRPARIEPVSAVWVGNVLDTQRRRREQVVEAYEKIALAS